MPATPDRDPPEPAPREMLAVAEQLAAGEHELRAALRAKVSIAAYRRMRADPDFDAVLAECAAARARPAAERDEILRHLIRHAVELSLTDGRVGAIPVAMRLLDPSGPPGGGGSGDPEADDDDGDEEDRADREALANAALARWGMRSDGRGGWLGPDGAPAMPGRKVHVVPAEDGPVRLLDTDPAAAPAAYIAVLDAMDEAGVDKFNRGAYPHGGPQWDRRTRTHWRWVRPDDRPPVAEPEASAEAGPTPPPAASTPAPAAPPERSAAVTALPAPATPLQRLRARLDRLLAKGGEPGDAEELDLAEAVCARVWPNWPRYAGPIDTALLGDILAATPLDPARLARLGGVGDGTPPAAAARGPPR